MGRVETLRKVVDEIIRQQPNVEESRCGFVHLYGVAETCALLALKRGFDPEICVVAGMLHDIASYKTGDTTDHANRSALEAEIILRENGEFSEDEIIEVCQAISQHSNKEEVNGKFAELLKDADVLQHYLYNPSLARNPDVHWQRRLSNILCELMVSYSASKERA